MDQLAQTYDTNLVVIRYHTPGPDAYDPYYHYNTGENMARLNYYSDQYVPWLWLDGASRGSDQSLWGGYIRSRMAVSSPITISLSGTFNRTSRTGTINVMIAAIDSITNTSLKLRIAVTQSNIDSLGPNGTRYHNQTFRDLTPNSSGISLSIARGDTLNFSQSFSCPSPLVINNCAVAVFVQSDASGHAVLQAAKIRLATLAYQLNVFSLISPPDRDTFPNCNPNLIWHSTRDVDSGYAVSYVAEICSDSTFENLPLLSDTLSDTSWICPVCLMSDTTYYWRVVAFNGHAPERFSAEKFRLVVHELGRCVYTPGDVNGNLQVNGVDVVYAVNYLKGTGAMPPVDCFPFCPLMTNPFYAAGDVNGNCAFNGIDITYYVRFLKGQATELLSCPDCPPAPSAMNKHRAKNFSILH